MCSRGTPIVGVTAASAEASATYVAPGTAGAIAAMISFSGHAMRTFGV